MTREEFIEKAKDLGLEVTEGNKAGWPKDYDGVYANGKEITLSNGSRYKPYIRVSGFDTGDLYIREDGLCNYCNDNYVLNRLEALAEES